MIEVELIGRPSWPKRARQFLRELFGSHLVAHLERELMQAKLERDKTIAELRAENRELLNRLLSVKAIVPIAGMPAGSALPHKTALGPTRWEQLQAKAIEDNARAEAEDAAKQTAAQEN